LIKAIKYKKYQLLIAQHIKTRWDIISGVTFRTALKIVVTIKGTVPVITHKEQTDYNIAIFIMKEKIRTSVYNS
jgi:hypothetical protein